ncbi:hypothetical protein BVG18_17730 (plasmid) [Acinetobacter lwoffii]|uniref:hypothetical protein n=1 Tax=Acinetobacter lwoffii TaxID=28090 RepID=UPI00129F4194|nr:hypothetical protein BVG18_17730 [Acinetobacter lwoffii]
MGTTLVYAKDSQVMIQYQVMSKINEASFLQDSTSLINATKDITNKRAVMYNQLIAKRGRATAQDWQNYRSLVCKNDEYATANLNMHKLNPYFTTQDKLNEAANYYFTVAGIIMNQQIQCPKLVMNVPGKDIPLPETTKVVIEKLINELDRAKPLLEAPDIDSRNYCEVKKIFSDGEETMEKNKKSFNTHMALAYQRFKIQSNQMNKLINSKNVIC